MLLSGFYRNILRVSVRQLSVNVSSNSLKYYSRSRTNLLRLIVKPNVVLCRRFNGVNQNPESTEEPAEYLPHLTKNSPLIWPTVFNTIGNFIIASFMIPRLDKDFIMMEFLEGAKHAVTMVSKALSQEDYEPLDGLVAPDVISTLKTRINSFTPVQKSLIEVKEDDIFMIFTRNINVLDDEKTSRKRYLEIMVVVHQIRGMSLKNNELLTKEQFNMKNMFVCNYRFIRDYFKEDSAWEINMINHFMPRYLYKMND